eukprot:g522.t1
MKKSYPTEHAAYVFSQGRALDPHASVQFGQLPLLSASGGLLGTKGRSTAPAFGRTESRGGALDCDVAAVPALAEAASPDPMGAAITPSPVLANADADGMGRGADEMGVTEDDERWSPGGENVPLAGEESHVLSWRNVTFSVKTHGGKTKRLLSSCYGELLPGQLTALVGPSGAGKSTLLNLLAARQSWVGLNREECSICLERLPPRDQHEQENLNSDLPPRREMSFAEMRATIAYVMQEDHLLPTATVHETLTFAAKLKLPHLPSAAIKARVNAILTELDLLPVRDVRIGSALRKGLSGGQRKRVSTAIELLARPKILFLDEPTSGLDSFSSLRLIAKLKEIAVKDRAIVCCTIHQPSSELFDNFDSVLCLRDGEVLLQGYSGKRAAKLVNAKAFGLMAPLDGNVVGLEASQRAAVDAFGTGLASPGAARGSDAGRLDESEGAAASPSTNEDACSFSIAAAKAAASGKVEEAKKTTEMDVEQRLEDVCGGEELDEPAGRGSTKSSSRSKRGRKSINKEASATGASKEAVARTLTLVHESREAFFRQLSKTRLQTIAGFLELIVGQPIPEGYGTCDWLLYLAQSFSAAEFAEIRDNYRAFHLGMREVNHNNLDTMGAVDAAGADEPAKHEAAIEDGTKMPDDVDETKGDASPTEPLLLSVAEPSNSRSRGPSCVRKSTSVKSRALKDPPLARTSVSKLEQTDDPFAKGTRRRKQTSSFFCRPLLLLIEREWLHRTRDVNAMVSKLLIPSISVMIYSLAYANVAREIKLGVLRARADPDNADGDFYVQSEGEFRAKIRELHGPLGQVHLLVLMSAAQALLMGIAVERPVFNREFHSGFYSVPAYVFAKVTVETVLILVQSAWLLFFPYILWGLCANFATLWATMSAMGLCGMATGLFLATMNVNAPENALLWGPVFLTAIPSCFSASVLPNPPNPPEMVREMYVDALHKYWRGMGVEETVDFWTFNASMCAVLLLVFVAASLATLRANSRTLF